MKLFSLIPLQCRIVSTLKKIFLDNDYYCDCHEESHHRPMGVSYVMGFISVAVGLMVGARVLDAVTEEDPLAGLPNDVMEIITPTCKTCNEF